MQNQNKFWNVPNVLSLIRLALVPIMLLCFFLIPGEDHLAAMIIYVVASLTDVLDGFIARSTHQITKYGVVLDPFADKLLKMSTLIAFAIVGILPIWLVSILIFIDLGMIIAGACLFKKKITIPSNVFGKLGTLVMSLGLLLCFFDGSLHPWNLYIVYIGMVIVVASLIIYILLNYKRVFGVKSPTKAENEQNAEVAAEALADVTAKETAETDADAKGSVETAASIEVDAPAEADKNATKGADSPQNSEKSEETEAAEDENSEEKADKDTQKGNLAK